jgi:peptide-methionine (S)-S-oxide reductase
VHFWPDQISYEELVQHFWENHDPTQGMAQGHDHGTQYRSAVYYVSDAQKAVVEASRARYAEALKAAGYGAITTEVAALGDYWFAEEYHQQYLAKNPEGYCGLGGTGVSCPSGLSV